MSDKRLAQVARSLAAHLRAYAKERREEDKKAIASCHSELCQVYLEDLDEQRRRDAAKQPPTS